MNPEQMSEKTFEQWKSQTSQSTSLSLGTYQISVTPVAPYFFEKWELYKTSRDAKSCFFIQLVVKSHNKEQALLQNFRGELEESSGEFYHLEWLVNEDPLKTYVPGASGRDIVWQNEGLMCSYGEVVFQDYFGIRIWPEKPTFPFYGSFAHLEWSFSDIGPKGDQSKGFIKRSDERRRPYQGN